MGSSVVFNSMERQDATVAFACKVLRNLRHEFVKQGDAYKYQWNRGRMTSFDTLKTLCANVKEIFKKEKTLLRLASPTYVFGDIHGNYHDLSQFSQSTGLLRTAEIVPSSFLFLGDYVDRGAYSVEVVTFLFAMKCVYPNKVFMLRGNHEIKSVNSTTEGSLMSQCTAKYFLPRGDELYSMINDVFEHMPLCAVIDGNIFCAHGGIPRVSDPEWFAKAVPPGMSLLDYIEQIPRPPAPKFFPVNGDFAATCAYDLMWQDPGTAAEMEFERMCATRDCPDVLPFWNMYPPNFCPNYNRDRRKKNPGKFNEAALEHFFRVTGCTKLFRAHECFDEGVEPFHNDAVFTVFSSSNYSRGNSSAILLVHNDDIKPVRIAAK